jgi:hypothetical protein
MIQKILISLTLIAAMCFSPALQTTASARIELSDIDIQQPKIDQNGNAIIISNAPGKTVRIYNLIGTEVTSVRIDAAEKRIDLSNFTKGIYLVKVGNTSKKIHISGK